MRVILADDAVLFREGMARILSEAGIEVVGQAPNAAKLLDLVSRDPPDVAIIDIRMPPGHSAEGIEAAAEIRRMSRDSLPSGDIAHPTSRSPIQRWTGRLRPGTQVDGVLIPA